VTVSSPWLDCGTSWRALGRSLGAPRRFAPADRDPEAEAEGSQAGALARLGFTRASSRWNSPGTERVSLKA